MLETSERSHLFLRYVALLFAVFFVEKREWGMVDPTWGCVYHESDSINMTVINIFLFYFQSFKLRKDIRYLLIEVVNHRKY